MKSERDELYKLRSLNPNDLKGFVLDFDRTITNWPAKHEFNPNDIDANLLEQLKGTGINLILATGRPLSYVQKLCRSFDIWTCMIAENGAIIYIPNVERTITIDTGHMDGVRRIISKLNLEHIKPT